jgi:peptidoglycan/LPS O-acetylase OafA/YrhL
MADRNNFDGVRVGLALIVVFAHVSVLTELPDFRLFGTIFDSNFAVKGFFTISGFLVTASYIKSRTFHEYATKRLRRIYPAYTAAVLLCLLIGCLVSSLSLSDFFSSKQTTKYLISNLTFLNFIQPTLPGVFQENPEATVNGSLWTIKVEVMLYLCVPAIVFLFKNVGALKTTCFLMLLSSFWGLFFLSIYDGSMGVELARQFPGQLAYFIFGGYLAYNPRSLGNIKYCLIFLWPAIFATENPQLRIFIDPFAYSATVIWFSTLNLPYLNATKFGDISYGLYLFHFPVIQLLFHLNCFSNPWLGLALTLITTTAISLVSWHFIESRFLKRSSHYENIA